MTENYKLFLVGLLSGLAIGITLAAACIVPLPPKLVVMEREPTACEHVAPPAAPSWVEETLGAEGGFD